MTYTPSDIQLPYDGIIEYYPHLFSKTVSDEYFEILANEIHWEHDKIMMFGKEIITKRKVGWYGLKPYEYTYSKNTKVALPYTEVLNDLSKVVQGISDTTFNSCLLNYYHNGEEGMSYHTDNEKELKPRGTIASLSFGATRKFSFKHKVSKERIDLQLENGTLLLMKGEIQEHWMHALPKTKKVNTPRINLTFRTIID
ncbi:alpha-ketoglutarate-dependent dioxygenase AlkB [Flammeovirga yaeyamensis]|uniref:Alpha-ketoglutarate-dependent dioxygenase AlkB n=1 Tax=Flammeovirga yaeyamensis TaxID=367791 RepID=A0AAX1NB70_9BACT|nr:alpha-ketoglutarate-dependent dioxygenase AlkB [Flammeovirga yaeyamensis]MBB3699887.1 alkylated DNA repair dioxygenase AlkB [Flammeovirga yaeyamensis]NMF38317.1 alpha-ketoglutarate-dependent dioxygenase AlkB [Flammeovirga yaeyamensis]QWG04729.1 alpha-ketoglutarate-dependent dioxygenase AlkB [Flammeovirga yaeyamensis]